ncbi:MAG: hypothetical protein ACI9F9_000457, partial [Candidatus Paceibacteria bacterium]
APAQATELLDLVLGRVKPGESVAWIGNSTEISPAALHLALLQRSADKHRFLEDAQRPLDVTFSGSDPNWSSAQLAEFMEGFDLAISTDPPDLMGRESRAFMRRYSAMLVDDLGWVPELVGKVMIAKDPAAPLEVSVYALRPPE